jgi:hypothetical protein
LAQRTFMPGARKRARSALYRVPQDGQVRIMDRPDCLKRQKVAQA